MGFMLKVVLICLVLGGIGVGNVGLNGSSPESIAVGVLGVIVALISMTFFLRFLWRFLGCLSTIVIALILVVILLVLTGTFDTVAGKVAEVFGMGGKTSVAVPQGAAGGAAAGNTAGGVAGADGAGTPPVSASASLPDGAGTVQNPYLPILGQDGTTSYVPASALAEPQAVGTAGVANAQGQFSGSIAGVRTGSQFVVDDLKVILFGIDTPDPDQTCSDRRGRPYQCGQEAIRQLKKFTGATPLKCKVMAKGQTDNYLVSAVCNINSNDLGAAMVAAGWAFAKPSESQVYIPYEQVAKGSKNGMWSGQFYTPAEWRKKKGSHASSRSSSGGGGGGSDDGGVLKSLFGGLF